MGAAVLPPDTVRKRPDLRSDSSQLGLRAEQRSDPWEKGSKLCAQRDCRGSLLAGSFQTAAQGGGTQTKPSNFAEVRRQKLEFGEAEVAGVRETGYGRGGSCVEGELADLREASLSLWLSSRLCREKCYTAGKRMNREPFVAQLSELAQGGDLIPTGQGRVLSECGEVWERVLGKSCLRSEAVLAQESRLLWSHCNKA